MGKKLKTKKRFRKNTENSVKARKRINGVMTLIKKLKEKSE